VEKEDLSKLKIDESVRTFRPAKSRKKFYLATVIVLAIVAAVLYFNGIISTAIPVEVATVSQVYPSQSLSQLNASGYVVAQRKAAVASKTTGRLVALMVEEGSRVREGQIIARLENDDVAASLNQAEANLNAARANLEEARAQREDNLRTFNRYKQLVSGGYIAKSQYDTAEAQYLRSQAAVASSEAAVKAAEAAVEGAKVAVDYTFIRAPFDAVVLTKNADVGDIVTPLGAAANAKAAVVTIADLGSLQVEADVAETNLGLIKKGQACEIQLDALPGSRFRGVVHAIVPTVDRSKATILVKVRFLEKDPRTLPEMRAKVAFLSRTLKEEEQKSFTALPPSSLVSNGNQTSVFVVHENRVMEKQIKAGQPLGDVMEVLAGVEPGERVVIKPPKRLKNGSRIKILEK
jgi:RND family efflux transporter MFP subunit